MTVFFSNYGGDSQMEHDPNINVSLTETDTAECIAINLPEGRIVLHTRSAIDLHHKLGLAILDWIGNSAKDYLP